MHPSQSFNTGQFFNSSGNQQFRSGTGHQPLIVSQQSQSPQSMMTAAARMQQQVNMAAGKNLPQHHASIPQKNLQQQFNQQQFARSMNISQVNSHSSNQQQKQGGTDKSDRCPIHGELICGYLPDENRSVCNVCIFQDKLSSERVKFIALVGKELNVRFVEAFKEYNASVEKIDALDPENIRRKFKAIVHEFFRNMKERLNAQRQEVQAKIKTSTNLRSLEQILEGSKEFFSICESQNGRLDQNSGPKQDQFEREKRIFDQKLNGGRYASVVKKQEFYKELINSLDQNCKKMRDTIDASSQQMSKVFRMNKDDRYIEEQLNALVAECIEIDLNMIPQSPHSLRPLSHQNSPSVMSQDQNQQSHEGLNNLMGNAASIQQKMQQMSSRLSSGEKSAEHGGAPPPQAPMKDTVMNGNVSLNQMRTSQSKSNNSMNESGSELSGNQENQENTIQSASSHSGKSSPKRHSSVNNEQENKAAPPAAAVESVTELKAPEPPKIQQPVHPGNFQMPTCPPNLPDHQRQQFALFCNMKMKAHREKLVQFNEQMAAFRTAHQDYQQKLQVYNKQKQELLAKQQAMQVQQAQQQNSRLSSGNRNSGNDACSDEQMNEVEEIDKPPEGVQSSPASASREIIQIDPPSKPMVQPSFQQQSQQPHIMSFGNTNRQNEQIVQQDSLFGATGQSHRVSGGDDDVQIQRVNSSENHQPQPMKQQDNSSDIVIVGQDEVNSSKSVIVEHTYKTAFKLKSMKLLQLVHGQGWKHLLDIKDLYMAKIAYNPECDKIYVMGGAKDQRSKVTIADTFLYNLTSQGIHKYRLESMNEPRASFGSLFFSRREKESIIVVGGYINGKLTTKCELYSVQDNKWTCLPDLNEAKASSSLCILNDRYLLCLGGLSRNSQGQAYLTNSIEVLSISTFNSSMPSAAGNWHKMSIQLPITGCDIGCLPIDHDEVLIFGGWNKQAQTGVYIMKRPVSLEQDMGNAASLSLQITACRPLAQADFFLVNGIAMKHQEDSAGQKIRICGHSQVFTYDLANKQFDGFQSF